QVVFCMTYAAATTRAAWPACLALASGTFVIAAVALNATILTWAPAIVLFGLAIAASLIGLASPILRPAAQDASLPAVRPGRYDIPARAAVATLLVLAISAAAPIVGGHVAGLLATFPVYISVLTTFAHRVGGGPQARGVLRGLVLGLPGFAVFFLAVAAFVESLGVLPAFSLALTAAVALNLVALRVAIRRPGERTG
ncbi:MAG TPA: hypothetical protein VET90_03880, partial [Candidatus Binatus sp.]|nr:hypothetical protein [Candidatus Binatus sp.]